MGDTIPVLRSVCEPAEWSRQPSHTTLLRLKNIFPAPTFVPEFTACFLKPKLPDDCVSVTKGELNIVFEMRLTTPPDAFP